MKQVKAVQQRLFTKFYLEVVLRPQFPSALNNHTDRELKTEAAAIDALIAVDAGRRPAHGPIQSVGGVGELWDMDPRTGIRSSSSQRAGSCL